MSYFGYPLYPLTPTTQANISFIVGTTTLGAGAVTYGKAFEITGAGGYTVTLPAIDAVNFPTQSFTIYNASSALCTINTNGSDTALFLGSSYSSISILPGERIIVQNMATNWVIALESAQRTVTPTQFDNTIRIPTTAFVQTNGIRSSGLTLVTGNTTLTTSVAGGTVLGNSTSATTVTLPASSTFPAGTTIEFLNINTGTMTVSASGSDVIQGNSGTGVSTGVANGDTLYLRSGGGSGSVGAVWFAIGGSRQLGSSAAFNFFESGNGYQKFPSGMIFQWQNPTTTSSGTGTFNFPIAFPSACLNAVASPINTGANTSSVSIGTITTTGATYWTLTATSGNPQVSGALGFHVFAIGY
jgi:hypothetical protein